MSQTLCCHSADYPAESPKCYDEHGAVVPMDCCSNQGYLDYPNDPYNVNSN